MFDTDATGVRSAQALKEQYNTIPIYFTNGLKSKDPSDMVKDYGYSKTIIQFKNVLKKIYYGN